MTATPDGEHVLVVPARVDHGRPRLARRPTDGARRASRPRSAREGRFRAARRDGARPALKQVIPYLVLRDGERYFLMRRTRAGGDARLHDRWSIGVGGHLNPGDGDLAGGLRREWREELVADFEPEFRLVGLLNDDTTDVGSVHLGAVYVADAGGPARRDPRDRQAQRRVRRPAEVAAVVERMETWSALVFDAPRGDCACGARRCRARCDTHVEVVRTMSTGAVTSARRPVRGLSIGLVALSLG